MDSFFWRARYRFVLMIDFIISFFTFTFFLDTYTFSLIKIIVFICDNFC